MDFTPKHKKKSAPVLVKSLKVGDSVVVLHSSRLDTVREVQRDNRGNSTYFVHSTTFEYDRNQLVPAKEFTGTIRPAPEPRKSRYVSGSAQNPDLEILEVPEPEISETQNDENSGEQNVP